ncbi:MAG: hypothetical protein AAFV98_14530 [Chloroflexota bacterium]
MVRRIAKQIILCLSAWVLLSACQAEAQPENVDLPTQARFPTETVTFTPNANLTEIALERTLPASFTPTDTPTNTPTNDPSITPTLTSTVTITPSATITNTPSPTPPPPPTLAPEDRPILAFALTAAAATVLPTDYQVPGFTGADVTLIPTEAGTPDPNAPPVIVALGTGTTIPQGVATVNTASCTTATTGGFLTIYQSNSNIASQLGCPVGAVTSIPAAWQNFQTGIMVWLNGEILVLYNNNNTALSVTDTWVDGVDPQNSTETPPAGLFTPIRGFLKVWDTTAGVRDGLGWATTGENGTTASVQAFTNGRMIFLPGRTDVLILIETPQGRQWLSIAGSY